MQSWGSACEQVLAKLGYHVRAEGPDGFGIVAEPFELAAQTVRETPINGFSSGGVPPGRTN